MDPLRRSRFNAAYSDALFGRFMGRLAAALGPFPFRVAETPLFFTHALRDRLAREAMEIVGQLSEPHLLNELKEAIPPRYSVPHMDALPNCVQVDFALVKNEAGEVEGKVVELQAFPSLYSLMAVMGDKWAETLNEVPGLKEDWSCFITQTREAGIELMRRTLVGDMDPAHVVLVDHEPGNQKTVPDFVATEQLFGVRPVCMTTLVKDGRKLYRRRTDNGKLEPVERIYNRMVFDEIVAKAVKLPFEWNDELDISWCSHPNWYWVWSKYALPSIDHPAVPRAQFLSDLVDMPEDLSRYVLKPLFSFAGAGVVIDVTKEDIDRVPMHERHGWVLQEKIDYAPVIPMPDGNGVKAEVRVMLIRPPEATALVPIQLLVRLSRGKMLGVDFNKGLTWVGGSVGMWPR